MALGNVQLTPQFVQAVRDAVDIVDIASEHTKLKRAGRRYSGLCPLHKEKTPSFSVDPVQGLFYCFGCGAGGDAIKLHMAVTGDDFPSAIEALARRYGVALPAVRRAPRGDDRAEERDLERVLEAAREFFTRTLERSDVARRYLSERRMPGELVTRFGLGYAPDEWRALLGALTPRISIADLIDAGLAARPEGGGEPYDRFRNRLIFPIRNAAGRLVGFGGRTLGDDRAKYVNTAETERFHKGTLLYGLDLAKKGIRESGRALLVEGYFDVLGAHAAGVEGAVASMGTSLTVEQARLLARYAEEVVVGYDGDPAGESASQRALPILLAERLLVRRAVFPDGHDPDSLRLAAGETSVRHAVAEAEDFVERELERMAPLEAHRTPRLQARAAKEAAELVRTIPDAVLRFGYARRAADRLRIPPQLLFDRVGVTNAVIANLPAGGGTPGASRPGAATTPGADAEEAALRQLFAAAALGQELPPPEELPAPEIFMDMELRNFFAAFLALYSETGRPPGAPEIGELAARAGSGESVGERLARLLIEFSDSTEVPDPAARLRELRRRWLRERQKEIQAALEEADRCGDAGRIRVLLEERARLTREIHPAAPESVGS